MSSAKPPHPPRSLADQLRSWPDERVARLLAERPDLAAPVPRDSGQLASRAGARASVARALDQLNVLELTVLDAVQGSSGSAAARHACLDEIRSVVNADPQRVEQAVARLRELALVWGEDAPDTPLRTVGVLGDLVGTSWCGLGRSARTLLAGYGPTRVTALAEDLGLRPTGDRAADIAAVAECLSRRETVSGLLDELDPRARAILDHLDAEGRPGSVESTDRTARRGDRTAGPVDQLLARGLVLAADSRQVEVPREVGIGLREGHTTLEPADDVPPLATSSRDAQLVDQAAAGAAFDLVRRVELLLDHWGTSPPSALRGGGLGVRELRAAARLLHLEEPAAALHVEVAHAAGLLALGDADDRNAWLPTDAFDLWQAGSVADRWTTLALAWLGTPRMIGLVGTREPASGAEQRGKPVNALSPDLVHGWLPETRVRALRELHALPRDQVLATGTGPASLVTRLDWLRPRSPALRQQAVTWLLEEGAALGVLALGGLASHGRALLEAEDPRRAIPAILDPLLPEPVDHVLLQADLTAIAPGPLTRELAHDLALLADVESRGGATVYRFTEHSVRRAFDHGWSAAEVHAFVADSSRTPVPQPLSYLIDDVSRTFGTVRVGAAESFVRSDDETALATLLHDPGSLSLRLRRIAPTVLVSDVPVDVLLPRLRELGIAPVVEAPDGTVRLTARQALRSRGRRPQEIRRPAPSAAQLTSTVAAIRAGDRAAQNRPEQGIGGRISPAEVLSALREAADAAQSVWIGYVDNHGTVTERVVDPVHVHAGELSAYDQRSQQVRLFAVHRITGVRALT
ncbi:MAG TPA: helicase C-terminal domain-containing protein [Nocardioidaceae bacterium]|nr:helicase C-terminal domain-containing protein [Nocardioidaceae bacterium]